MMLAVNCKFMPSLKSLYHGAIRQSSHSFEHFLRHLSFLHDMVVPATQRTHERAVKPTLHYLQCLGLALFLFLPAFHPCIKRC